MLIVPTFMSPVVISLLISKLINSTANLTSTRYLKLYMAKIDHLVGHHPSSNPNLTCFSQCQPLNSSSQKNLGIILSILFPSSLTSKLSARPINTTSETDHKSVHFFPLSPSPPCPSHYLCSSECPQSTPNWLPIYLLAYKILFFYIYYSLYVNFMTYK